MSVFSPLFQLRKPSLREVILAWSRVHDLTKEELGFKPQSSDTQSPVLSLCTFLSPQIHCPRTHPTPNFGKGQEGSVTKVYHSASYLPVLSIQFVSFFLWVFFFGGGVLCICQLLYSLELIDLGISVQTSVGRNLRPVKHGVATLGWLSSSLFFPFSP